jgi:hypothetical protein
VLSVKQQARPTTRTWGNDVYFPLPDRPATHQSPRAGPAERPPARTAGAPVVGTVHPEPRACMTRLTMRHCLAGGSYQESPALLALAAGALLHFI